MANLFLDLPLPVLNGPGAAVDTSAMGGPKTVQVVGSFPGCTVAVEVSVDAGVTWAPLTSFQNQGGQSPRVFEVAAERMRVNVQGRKASVPFAANADVGANDGGALFVALPLPVLNGAGTAVDVSALGTRMTFVAGGLFQGATIGVEISEDGVAYAPLCSFASKGSLAMAVSTANWARANVQGRKSAVPFTGTLAAGALNDSSGGGGAGGSNCLIFRPGSGETGPVVFDDWDELYTALEDLRADANDDGCYTIMFDDTDVSPAIVPAGAYDMTHVTWEGKGSEFTSVNLAEGVVLTGLRVITGGLDIEKSAGATSPISDLGTITDDVFQIGFGVRLQSSGGAAAIIDHTSNAFDVKITLGDFAEVLSSDTIHTSNAAAQTSIDIIGAESSIHQNSISNVVGATTNVSILNDANRLVSFIQSGALGTFEISNGTNVRYNLTVPYTENEEADYNELVQVDPSAAVVPVVIALPEQNFEDAADAAAGRPIIIKNVTSSSNPIEVTPSGTDTIDGSAGALTIAGGFDSVELVADGLGNWNIVAYYKGAAGVYSPPELWAQNPTPASQVAVPLDAQVSTAFDDWKAIVAGSVVRMGVRFVDPITSPADDATLTVTINGVIDPLLQLVCNSGSNPSGGEVVIAAGVVPYVAGDLIGVAISTDAGFTPVDDAVEVQLQVKDA